MTDTAKFILQRANDANISISNLCRRAGVSRGWFEKLKSREPKSVKAYFKMISALEEREERLNAKKK